jgi:hypothetical protein
VLSFGGKESPDGAQGHRNYIVTPSIDLDERSTLLGAERLEVLQLGVHHRLIRFGRIGPVSGSGGNPVQQGCRISVA